VVGRRNKKKDTLSTTDDDEQQDSESVDNVASGNDAENDAGQ